MSNQFQKSNQIQMDSHQILIDSLYKKERVAASKKQITEIRLKRVGAIAATIFVIMVGATFITGMIRVFFFSV